ncbi:hypothetical protein VTL71DRAFT_3665 [Oculimacula yallundae]|uniref:Extracellular membrane protein CFEM domain-containing protein n=1 Tax=Oculimacula yallundae TaxID=86028 RepID=A0ABR4C3K1_9HELO
MKPKSLHLAFISAWFSKSKAWDEDTFASCAWPCVTNFPNPECNKSESSSWESCFCSNETLIAAFDSCVQISSCADSEKIDVQRLCSSTTADASEAYAAALSSQYDEIEKWSTSGGSWSAYHSRLSTSGTQTSYDKGSWQTDPAGPWGSGSWPESKCPASNWPGWASSGTWDRGEWDQQLTSWTSWTDCSVSTTTTASTPGPGLASTITTALLASATSLNSIASTGAVGSVVTSTSTPSASSSVLPVEGASGSNKLSEGILDSARLVAMCTALISVFLGMTIVF